MSTLFGISGDAGSFSEEAALVYAKQNGIEPTLVHLLDMEGVLHAIENETIALGIVPVVNLIGGLVKPAFQAMGRHLFTPIDELWHEINQCLLVKPGIQPHQITHIVSHPQGFAQCRQFLQQFKNTEHIEWIDTAKAAKDLAEGILPPHSAIIASARCAELYGLEIKAAKIQDSQPNRTAFILVKKHHNTNLLR
ncbi:chorismate mutase/prephenate dehydratase (P-protein) [Legionella steigerwaltii]|uniref:prephenate dehydratase n=1 Tax=Legionella steigerwaltii TaxID=460 RepID=A0A378LBM9_9GAMM|nr:prephenate dehydratase domain-containing protein [Legionella steigerwaltii]KTD78508.1 chorismate mutase/prephenate dehydratase [Legionella steigerwaltii]STY24134.1 chorismate mutase/prephenate dehydratase (P-protein) [Legionella steigerwaltii]